MRLPIEVLHQCWFLAGPTASGKTATALALAQRLNGEILSLDSMAIYRGMDIGTAKPSAKEQAAVPHHLIDLVDPHEEFSTAQYLQAAATACEEILNRGHVPIFAGGTGLYLRSLLRGVFEGPPADWELRNELQQQAEEQGPTWLHQQLMAVDPVTAARLHENDQRRVIRAIEIHRLTGRPASVQQQEGPLPPEERPQHVYWLSPPRDWLYDRINARVDSMLAAGWLAEVQRLLQLPNPPGRTARQALGYKELLDWSAGEIDSFETAVDLIKTRTRQFAKRQHTWFRNLEECHEVSIPADDLVDTLLHLSD